MAMHRRIEHFTKALDVPQLDLVGPVEVDEVYVSVGLKGRKHDQESRPRGFSMRGRGSYEGGKPSVFAIVDRETGRRCIVPTKSADESTVQLLSVDHEGESLIVYVDGFRVYNPLEDDDEFYREYVVHGDDEYADGDARVDTCEGRASLARRWLSPH